MVRYGHIVISILIFKLPEIKYNVMDKKMLGIVIGALLIPFLSYSQTYLYVSPQGDDSNKGTIQSPLLTLEKAVKEARKVPYETVLFLREGTYRLQKTIALTQEDGNLTKSLRISSYPGERAIVTSGKSLDLSWHSYKGGIMRAKMSEPIQMDMLVVNDTIRHMARFPNYDPKAIRFNGTSAEATSAKRVKKWKHPETGYLHAMHQYDWGDFHYRITGKDKDDQLLLEGGWQNNRKLGIHPDNRMVENIFEELDAPGEWFYDEEEKYLYYYPVKGEDVNSVKIESPQLKHLVEIIGTEQKPVMNIILENLVFTQTVRTFMESYEPLLRSDWSVYRGGAVFFEGAENCTLNNCDLYNLGGNAVFFSFYNKRNKVTGSHFTRVGASAICFVGDPKGVRSPAYEYQIKRSYEELDKEKGPQNHNFPQNCLVEDNLIHRIGLFEKQITGVELSMCQSITVSHNTIYDVPRAGINISEGTWGGHMISFNDVFNTVKETGDHGSINSWGRDRFWGPNYEKMEALTAEHPEIILKDAEKTVTIYNNRFRCDRGWDIDLDDGSSNYHIYNNLCLNGGIKLREGFYRIVENNIMVNNSLHPHVWFKNSGDVFTRNIIMSSYKPVQIRQWGTMVDYNLFADSISLLAARRNGTDSHSAIYSLKFKNHAVGDFTLPDASKELTVGGFHNIQMDQFGVVSQRLKCIAESPKFPKFLNTETSLEALQTKEWQGVIMKNLETLGERSATGMDSERGIYVLAVDPYGGRHTAIRENDVILSVDGKSVNTLDEFFKIVMLKRKKDKITLGIFRSQKEDVVSFELK